MKAGEAVHIGDGAYLYFDGYGFEFRANHHEYPTDRVYIDGADVPTLLRLIRETVGEPVNSFDAACTDEEEDEMPGPVSDSYDVEWGTADNAELIRTALLDVYDRISAVLGGREPLNILNVVQDNAGLRPSAIQAVLSEREWRIIRFALERAADTV